jgi:hypothetical protein
MKKWDHTGKACDERGASERRTLGVEMQMERGKNQGDAVKWFMPRGPRLRRCYVKFSADYQYNHHFLTLLAEPTHEQMVGLRQGG